MRLLKTGPYIPGQEKLEIIQKWGKDIPPYAILSHTWSTNPDDEVLLGDVLNGTPTDKPAFPKLRKAMERAKFDGYGWVWIDTCCMDKTSSVELSEAINSMYRYYENAEKCYAYLADVSSAACESQFPKSRWWRRGWTLQELLAPARLEFYSAEWESLGTKADLSEAISKCSGIDEEYLRLITEGGLPVQHASIAKRMSWASQRDTTRDEDLAYCLIGIFEVNMPMLYGEGGRQAFLRLQEEIMRHHEDQSLFAWIQTSGENSSGYHGLLADSPEDFRHTGSTITYSEIAEYNPSSMTARGLHMTLPLTQKEDGTSIAALQCPVPGRGHNDWLAIYLKRLPHGKNQYARVSCNRLASISELGLPSEIYVRQHFPKFAIQPVYPNHYFQLRRLSCITSYPEISSYTMVQELHAPIHVDPKHLPTAQRQPWSKVPLVYKTHKTAGKLTAAILIQRSHDREAFVLMLGAKSEFDVGFSVEDFSEIEHLDNFQEFEEIFTPQAAGTVNLEYHSVSVKFEEQVRAEQKIYFVDVEIEAVPKPSTVVEVLQDAMEVVVPSKGADRGANKAAFRDKVRRMWPMSEAKPTQATGGAPGRWV